MNYRNIIPAASLFLLILISTISGPGCANIIPPEGGPRDSIPPQLLKAEPGDSTRNFTGNRITFTFDEFVDVSNVQENLLMSPLPVNNPVIDFKLKTVTLKLKDTLESNTTYTFDFGNAIKDFAEGNVLKNFTYTFSTGRYIDSLQLEGKVILAETGGIDSTLIVMLHTSSDDSVVIRDKPRYITKLNAEGKFTFTNLPAKTFYLYALKDNGGTKRYMTDKLLFAFADKPVQVQGKNEPITLYAYAKPAPQQATAIAVPKGRGNNADKRLKYQTSLIDGQQDLLSDFYMQFDLPLRSFDSTKLTLFSDSAFTRVEGYSFIKDSTRKRVRLQLPPVTGQPAWKENTLYHIILDKDFAEDSAGKKLLKTDTLSFKTKRKAEYGFLKLKLRNLDLSKNPVLIFFNSGGIINSYPLAGPDFSLSLVMPGEYQLRILYDANKNGIWDPGQFFG
ncbi:MAG: Ig-like domain-containing protein, partial [Chitinophagaceae bacterium]|nr:Ig-like domain-containing protein [Chitinophagaceae bacterium]